MSDPVSIIDQELIDQYKDDVLQLFRVVFGTDLLLGFRNDGSIDLELVGGDIKLAGTATGNTLDDVLRLIEQRIKTRLLTYYSESELLPMGYGSYLTDIIGYSIIDTEDATDLSQGVLSLADLQMFVDSMVRLSLMSEPLVTEIKSVETVWESTTNTVWVNIVCSSLFLEYISINLQLLGD